MIIDAHAHLGDLRRSWKEPFTPISVDDLLRRLDEDGIDQAVVLPWPACPEAVVFPGLFHETPDVISQIRAAARHPDRLILFGNADPRWGGNSPDADFGEFLDRLVDMGCVGMGEVSANIPFDDPRTVNLFRQCGDHGMPVTIESTGPGPGHYGFVDRAGSPAFERLLQAVPGTVVIGHGPGFWAEISGDVTDSQKCGYPSGPVTPGGSVARLLAQYTNLYADLSAGSAWNAISRDLAFGDRFLQEFAHKLMFGSDVCFSEQAARTPMLPHLRELRQEGRLSADAAENILWRNARALLA